MKNLPVDLESPKKIIKKKNILNKKIEPKRAASPKDSPTKEKKDPESPRKA